MVPAKLVLVASKPRTLVDRAAVAHGMLRRASLARIQIASTVNWPTIVGSAKMGLCYPKVPDAAAVKTPKQVARPR